MVKRIELSPDIHPSYIRLEKVTGISSPTHLNNLVWSLAGDRIADHLEQFNLDSIKSISDATKT
jgi:hypothetical protein